MRLCEDLLSTSVYSFVYPPLKQRSCLIKIELHFAAHCNITNCMLTYKDSGAHYALHYALLESESNALKSIRTNAGCLDELCVLCRL